MSDPLTPLERDALSNCVRDGSTRANDGSTTDAMLSILCSKPGREDPYVRWQMNPTSRQDGYISLYTATERGRQEVKDV